MKHTKEMHIHWKQGFEGEDQFSLFICDMSQYGYVLIGKQEVEFEVPDDFNPVPIQVAMLNAEKKRIANEFDARVRAINEQISKLQCITF